MWRIIKWIILLAIIGGVVLWFTGYKVAGKTIQEHLKPVLEKKIVKEGIHDIRQIVGEGLKAAGEAISEEVTDSERKQLDDLLKQEMMKGKPIEGSPGQQALPPAAPPQGAAPAPTQPRPTAAQMLQQVQPAPTTAPTPAAPAAPQAMPAALPAAPQMAPPPAPPAAAPQEPPAQPQVDEAY